MYSLRHPKRSIAPMRRLGSWLKTHQTRKIPVFLESFPDSGLSKVARLKLRMINKKEKKIKKEQKTAEIKPKKKRTEYWENTSLKQEWFRSDQNTKRGLLGSMAACNRLFIQVTGGGYPQGVMSSDLLTTSWARVSSRGVTAYGPWRGMDTARRGSMRSQRISVI